MTLDEYRELATKFFLCEATLPKVHEILLAVLGVEGSYNVISKMSDRTLGKFLGYGREHIVFNLGEDKVIKYFLYDNPKGKPFYEYCLKNSPKEFPKVYRLTDSYVVTEKLKTLTPNIEKFHKEHLYIRYISFKDLYKTPTSDTWTFNVQRYCKEMGYLEGTLDFRRHNLGERDNGEIVIFDI